MHENGSTHVCTELDIFGLVEASLTTQLESGDRRNCTAEFLVL